MLRLSNRSTPEIHPFDPRPDIRPYERGLDRNSFGSYSLRKTVQRRINFSLFCDHDIMLLFSLDSPGLTVLQFLLE
jgi:hypothetical protein